ncbi:unnamed protein product [Nippostrongylus brasiliensis]|uniref:Transmembrane protein n=1 Tax=Nippostrongylus brasiliensis TaxID=27835 RepID=A0A0N4YPJ1_NIPBR|nr:unnamed protein product [Nippostrongylus brasiliensis]
MLLAFLFLWLLIVFFLDVVAFQRTTSQSGCQPVSYYHTANMVEVMVEANVEDRPVTNGLDWEKLFKMAEDPDLDDIDRGPIENAIANL